MARALLVLMLLLTACWQQSTNPPPKPNPNPDPTPTGLTKAGLLWLDEVSTYDFNLEPPITGTTVTGRASFVQLTTRVTDPPSNPFGSLDGCTVGAAPNYQPLLAAGNIIDAGASITIRRADNSTFTTLSKQAGGSYQGVSASVLPTGVLAVIPGAVFPAVNSTLAVASLSSGLRAQGFSLVDPQVGASADLPDITWRWVSATPPSGASVMVALVATGDLGGGNSVTALCLVNDDGEFTLPQTTANDLGGRGLSKVKIQSEGRFVAQVQKVGTDAYLIKVTSSQLKAP